VDSSAAAALAEAGWTTGVPKLADTPDHLQVLRTHLLTPTTRAGRGHVGVPFYARDMAEEFQRAVVDDFAAEYAGGRTPNPCARCNEQVKVVGLLARARALGFDALATGHYARVEGGRLYRGADAAKDQSYVLYMLGPAELEHLRLPLGGLSKPEVRATAARLGLRTAAKPESYDVCFVPDGDTAGWLERRFGPRPGQVVDTAGRVLGHHRGAYRYTVGQRRGLGIAAPTPRYVLRVEPAAGRVVVGAGRAGHHHHQLEQAVATDGRPRARQGQGPPPAHGTEVGCRVVPTVPPGPRRARGQADPGARGPQGRAQDPGRQPGSSPGRRVRLEFDEPSTRRLVAGRATATWSSAAAPFPPAAGHPTRRRRPQSAGAVVVSPAGRAAGPGAARPAARTGRSKTSRLDDPAVLDRQAFGARSVLDQRGVGVVHQQGGVVVPERGDQLGAGQHPRERRHELPEPLHPIDPAGRRLAHDVVSDVGHRPVDVLPGPGVVVGQGHRQRGAGISGHGCPSRSRSLRCHVVTTPPPARTDRSSAWEM
jgi:tRNA-specific 2-thiouridylase